MNNFKKMNKMLKKFEKTTKKEDVHLHMPYYTYDNDFFSKDYFEYVLKNKIIVMNERLGEEPEEAEDELDAIMKANDVQPWYYKNKGKIIKKGFLAKNFKVKNDDKILNNFPKTKEILKMEKYWVHADWSGNYFLGLCALTGKKKRIEFKEVTFSIDEMSNIREWVTSIKPKGVVISCISSDKEVPITDICLGPVLDMFDIPELKYLKLLFVSKRKEGIDHLEEKYDDKVEFVIAYTRDDLPSKKLIDEMWRRRREGYFVDWDRVKNDI